MRARWVGDDVPSPVQSCLVTVDYRYVTKCFDFISFSAAFLDTPKEPSGDGTCLVFGLSPKSPAARLVCGERPGGESCHTVLALSGPLPSGVRPGPDVTRRGVSAGPEVWVKVVEAVRPFPSPPSNAAEDGKCPPSRFDNAVFSWPWTAQSPILAINWSFIGESAVGARRQAGERQSARRERVSSEREKNCLAAFPPAAARCPTQPKSVALADPPLPVVPLLHGYPQPTSQKTNTT